MSAPRLILFTPPLDTASVAPCAERLAAAAAKSDVACVVVRLAEPLREAALAPLLHFAASHDVALLSPGATRGVAKQGYDGVHVEDGKAAIAEALKILKPDRIVGAGGLSTRDDAMLAGEAGVDYVMFGEDGDGRRAAALIAWWSEVMEPPCAGFANTLDDIAAYAAAGADFVALGPALWHDSDDTLAEACAALAGHR